MTKFKYDASKLLYAHSENDRFIHQLEIKDDERATLLETRKKARRAIRNLISKLLQLAPSYWQGCQYPEPGMGGCKKLRVNRH